MKESHINMVKNIKNCDIRFSLTLRDINLNIKPCQKLTYTFYYSSIFRKYWIKTARILEGIMG